MASTMDEWYGNDEDWAEIDKEDDDEDWYGDDFDRLASFPSIFNLFQQLDRIAVTAGYAWPEGSWGIIP